MQSFSKSAVLGTRRVGVGLLALGLMGMSVMSGCGPTLIGQPDRLDFGQVLVGSSQQRSASWTNESSNRAELQGLSQNGSGAFAVTNPGAAEVGLETQERTAEVVVRFTPSEEGQYAATLTPLTASDGSVTSVELYGEGVYAMGLSGLDLDTPGRPTSEPFFFGSIPSKASGSREIGLHNRTTEPITIEPTWLSGDQGFSIHGSQDTVVVPAGSRVMLPLKFEPTRPGVFTDTLLLSVEGETRTAGLVVRGEGSRGLK